MSCDLTANGYSPTTDYVLDPSGGQMTEVSIGTVNSAVSQTWVHTNVTANGMLIATYDTTGSGLHFHLNDPLGSRRVQTDAAGFPEQTCQNLPFGNQLYCTGELDTPTEHHFTGLMHDTESGLDHAMFRQYASNAGRWMSPDPYDGSMEFGNPQTMNRYAYVGNMPLSYTDPLGLQNGDPRPPSDADCAFCDFFENIGNAIASFFGGHGHSFHESHTPRPNGNIKAAVSQGPIVAQANGTYTTTLGLSVPVALPVTEVPLIPWEQIGAGLAYFARAVPAVAASALLLNMEGDNKPNPNRCQEVRQRAIAVCTDQHLDGMRDNSGPFFACIRDRMAAEGCAY